MAKKRTQPPTPAPPEPQKPRRTVLIAVLAAVVAGAVIAFALIGSRTPAPADVAPAATEASAASPAAEPAAAHFGPHEQASYPPLPTTGYPPPRSTEVVGAAYRFAAEHPEVLGYIPCFCGCDRQGHRGNDDCFVARRDAKGDVIEWDSHGMT